MWIRNIFGLAIALLVCSFQAGEFSPMKDVEGFRAGIHQMAASTNTITASFKQEKYLSILADQIESTGTLHFKKPNLLSWEYQEPFQYGIVLNGKQLIINDQGNVNAFDIGQSQAFQQVNELIINSVQGDVLDESRFEIGYFEGKDLYLARLSPKEAQMKKFLTGIDVYFDKSDYSVARIRLNEPEGDYTLITFVNKKLNQPIPDEKFAIR